MYPSQKVSELYTGVIYAKIRHMIPILWFGIWLNLSYKFSQWPRGLMDKASDFGSEDCEFESRRGRLVLELPDISAFTSQEASLYWSHITCVQGFIGNGLLWWNTYVYHQNWTDHDETRTRNLLIRSQTPYPLGHAVTRQFQGSRNVAGSWPNLSSNKCYIENGSKFCAGKCQLPPWPNG